MHEIQSFDVKPIAAATPRSSLTFQGRATDCEVDGSILERQYSVGDRYLLLLTEGTPHEEGLHLYLLTSEFQLLDQLELGAAYAPGILNNVASPGPRTLMFTFFAAETWKLKVLESPRWGLNLPFRQPIRRPVGLPSRRWLMLERLDD
ncbi:MAG: hypothetical protein SGJ19_21145 [Planctomycetia bacterium]|nr:hypothetical protein [Planctomycetia bacterium]